MKLEAMKRQGERTDLQEGVTSDQVGRRLETAELIGLDTGDSRNQVRRFIRLTNLIPELLELVDQRQMICWHLSKLPKRGWLRSPR